MRKQKLLKSSGYGGRLRRAPLHDGATETKFGFFWPFPSLFDWSSGLGVDGLGRSLKSSHSTLGENIIVRLHK